jgi:hypothetical protein
VRVKENENKKKMIYPARTPHFAAVFVATHYVLQRSLSINAE